MGPNQNANVPLSKEYELERGAFREVFHRNMAVGVGSGDLVLRKGRRRWVEIGLLNVGWMFVMLDLSELQFSELIGLGRCLHHLCDDCDSMESAAQRIVETLFQGLCDHEGKPACVLTRLFVTLPVDALDEVFRKRALARLGEVEFEKCSHVMCLTLLGSMGVEPGWTNRRGSVGHAVTPLKGPEGLIRLPMISRLLEQLNIDPKTITEPNNHHTAQAEFHVYKVFHVEQAEGSPLLPAQEEFVKRYGIASAMGLGGRLPDGSLFAILLFSRVPISAKVVELFRPMALYVKLALLPFVCGPHFVGQPQPLTVDTEIIHSHVMTLDALLECKETLAQNQTQTLETQRDDLLLHKLVSDHSSDAIVLLSHQAQILFANTRACQKLGYTRPELLGLKLPVIAVETSEDRFQALYEMVKKGLNHPIESVYCRKDGTRFPVEIEYTLLASKDGQSMLAVARDISERKSAQEARIVKERMNEALVQADLDAIIVMSIEGRIQVFNPAAQRLFGYREDEAVGQLFCNLVSQEGIVGMTQPITSSLPLQFVRNLGTTTPWTGKRKNGEHFPLEMSLTSIDLPTGQMFLASIRDVSERARLALRLAQAEKLASLGLLGAGVLQEIINPLAYVVSNLAVIENYAHGLLEMIDVIEPIQEKTKDLAPELLEPVIEVAKVIDLPYIRKNLPSILGSTRKGINRIAEIVRSLRVFAMMEQPVIESVDLTELVTTSLETIGERFITHGVLIVREDIPSPRILCVFAQVKQVILNLLTNAQQSILAANRPDGKISIRTYPEPPWGVIEISDNGVGMSPEIVSRLFEPFFTTRPKGKGTGLGLAMSQGIINEHQGRIEVKSEPGQGATFRVLLPITGRLGSLYEQSKH